MDDHLEGFYGSGQGQRRQPRRWHQRTVLASPGRELARPGDAHLSPGEVLG